MRLHHHERRAPGISNSGVLGNPRKEPPKGNGRFARGAERIEVERGVDPDPMRAARRSMESRRPLCGAGCWDLSEAQRFYLKSGSRN